MSTETHTELPNCPLCGSAGHTLLRGFYHTHDPEQASPKQQNAVLCPTCRCRAPLESWDKRAVNSHDALVAALRDAQERLANISSGRCPDAPPGTANEPVAFRAWAEGYAAIGYRLARAALSSIGGGN